MQTVPVFVVPPVQREAGGGVATNVIEAGALVTTPPPAIPMLLFTIQQNGAFVR